jgi:hypothetical protein
MIIMPYKVIFKVISHHGWGGLTSVGKGMNLVSKFEEIIERSVEFSVLLSILNDIQAVGTSRELCPIKLL